MAIAVTVITFQQVVTAIHQVLEDELVDDTLRIVYNYDELLEGMNTWPCAECYVEEFETSFGSDRDRDSFCEDGTKRNQTQILVRVDLYARRRSQMNEDWREALILANAIQRVLETECTCPLFSQAGINDLHWTGSRVIFERAETMYAGYRFELTVTIY
jgi:hypothetical protein